MLHAFNSIDWSMARSSHLGRCHIHVGVILDMDSPVGEMAQQCMTMAISDSKLYFQVSSGRFSISVLFTLTHSSHTMWSKRKLRCTLNPPLNITNHCAEKYDEVRNHILVCKKVTQAAELLENEQVDALIGPQTSEEAEFLAELGDRVPIISFSASSPFLSTDKNPNFIRMTTNDNAQVVPIAAPVQEFGWSELVIIHEDSSYGNGIIPDLLLALEEANARVVHRTVIPPQARDIYVEVQLYKLMALSANIFIIHMSASLASRFFLKVNELGTMSAGYGWIVTDGIVNKLAVMDQSALDSMQGVIGIRPYIPPSKRLHNFSLKWRNSFSTNQHHQIPEVNAYCLYSITLCERDGLYWMAWIILGYTKVQRIIPKADKRLRIGVPIKVGFKELVGMELDPVTNATMVTGFCIDVFKAAIDMLPYEVKFDFIPFTNSNILMAASYYDDLIYQVYRQQYDAAVGDITIIANRSLYVDFTIPFTETGVAMIVPIETSRSTNMWIFIQPLTVELWLVIGTFFVFTGCVLWTIEHNDNDEFKGPLAQQIGIAIWYSFSTLVFAQREKLISNLSKEVVIVWLFVVLILTSSYTANLSSMLTVHQLQSMPKDESIGFPFNSPADQTFLINLPFRKHSFYPLKKAEDYANALRDGSQKGGVSAIIDEIPYVKLFLSKYSAQYTMVEPSHYSTKGFGFAFPKGSPLVPDISAAIAKMREEGTLYLISQNWFQNHSLYTNQDSETKVARLDLYSFRGLFLITGITSSVAAIASCKYMKKESTTSHQHVVADKPVEEKFSPVSDIPSRRTNLKHVRRYSY
ncbi:glutamate receptor 2.7 [Eucalyptus grandis]|uniref:glutamate receptor 2.7 n=1 Tax=Eucalyptus grandis TaxID=71139 RepID=UPI00192EAA16|nr:glutamate receptor 2.7 [Eucalyptus grandis]